VTAATRLALVGLVVYVPMLIEARRAATHERAQRARGGIEPAGDVYAVMRFAYPLSFAVMLVEGAATGALPAFTLGLALFAAAKALKWWAILALGPFWTFRVLVLPGASLVATGPYRFIRHPNYVAVAGELVGAVLMTGARVAGPIATLAFCALMLRRIQVENRALQLAESPAEAGRHNRRKSG
jgi:methyltransferase